MISGDWNQAQEDLMEQLDEKRERREMQDAELAEGPATLNEEELGYRCPHCDLFASFTYHCGYSVEPHGERHWDEWFICSNCGAELGMNDLDEYREMRKRKVVEFRRVA